MLVLTRKKAQEIHIGHNIVVKVIQTGRGSVKIGIDAPADIRVTRGELAEKLAQAMNLEVADNETVSAKKEDEAELEPAYLFADRASLAFAGSVSEN